jgi:uncharacterized protein (DUF362 family)
MINNTKDDGETKNPESTHFSFEGTVALFTGLKEYPVNPPYNPPKKFAEYYGDEIDESNLVYEKVRDLLKLLCLDINNFGTDIWNPLGEIISPGDSVVIKPNFVSHARSNDVYLESIISHSSIIRAMMDYVVIALKNKGEIIIADAPQADSDIEKIKSETNILKIINYLNNNSNIYCEFRDLRKETHVIANGIIIDRKSQEGDPKGYSVIDLKEKSFFSGIEETMNKVYGSDYDFHKVREHHVRGKHEYCISNTLLNADVVINLPKLKTHKKAGITGCLKNLIGINVDKNYLPHYRFGSKENGGDEFSEKTMKNVIGSWVTQTGLNYLNKSTLYSELNRHSIGLLYKTLYKYKIYQVNSGNWYGNDTVWRMIADINYIVNYSDKSGCIQNDQQRKHLCLVDGIIAGERNGPLSPQKKKCGILLGGMNPLVTDICAANCMGFDWKKIPSLANIFQAGFLYKTAFSDELPDSSRYHFIPPDGWVDHIEY